MKAPEARLNISTRDMVLAFVLAELLAVLVGAFIDAQGRTAGILALPVADVLSATLLVLLVMLGGRQPLKAVIAATSISRKVSPVGPLPWIPLALLAGLLLRFGTSGVVLGVLQILPHTPPTRPTIELINIPATTTGIGLVLIISTLLGAIAEELVFRRILQAYFCRKYGPVAGILGVAAAFGAIHASATIVLVGIGLSLLYLYSGRLWVAILTHAAGNLTVYAMIMLQPRRETVFMACCLSAVVLIAAMIFGFRSIRRSARLHD